VTYKHVDDQTAAYIIVTQKYFEDLKQVAGQIAGLLVLAAARSKDTGPDHPMLRSAEQLYKQAAEGLRSVSVSARARIHHDHLLKALAQLGGALSNAGDPLVQLQAAYAELRSASRTLPGFQMMSFERACCA
jgi:hypothetical protein